MNNTSVVWIGRITGSSGYGFATRMYIDAIKKAGIDVIMLDSVQMKIIGPENGYISIDYTDTKVTLRSTDPFKHLVVVFHDVPSKYINLHVEGRCRKVGLTVSETESLPRGWKSPLLNMDEIWTASDFNRKIFSYAGLPAEMIHVIPHCLDTSLYDSKSIGYSIYYSENTFNFLMVISNFNRKDIQEVIRAYCTVFQNNNNVNLLLKLPAVTTEKEFDKFITRPIEECAAYFGQTPPITLIKGNFSDEYMLRLYNSAHCYLAIERAKGWDLPAFQSMALGKVVIGLDWSANTEFMNANNSVLISAHESLVYADRELVVNIAFYSGHKWASFNFDTLKEKMADVYQNFDKYANIQANAEKTIKTDFSLEHIGGKILETISKYKSFDYASNHPAAVTLYKQNAPREKANQSLEGETLAALESYFKTPFFPLDLKKSAYKQTKHILRADEMRTVGVNKIIYSYFYPSQKRGWIRTVLDHHKVHKHFIGAYSKKLEALHSRLEAYTPTADLDAWVQAQRFAEGSLGARKISEKERSRLDALKDIHHGKRIFILGNGPSLNKIDFEKLKEEYTFGCNKIYLKYDTTDWRPNFYTTLDWRVTPDCYSEINEKTTESLCFFPKRFFGLLRNDENTYWYTTKLMTSCENNFSLDATQGIVGCGTIVYSALQLACHMGFSKIYLLGVDVNYVIPDTVIQSGKDRFNTGVKINLQSTADDDWNHFDARYFGKGMKWHDPNVDQMIRCFQQAKKCLFNTGIEIYNATPGGALEVFERVNFDSLFA